MKRIFISKVHYKIQLHTTGDILGNSASPSLFRSRVTHPDVITVTSFSRIVPVLIIIQVALKICDYEAQQQNMASTKSNENPSIYRSNPSKQGVFEDDFLYGVTVAQSSIDYRLGKRKRRLKIA